MSGKKQYRLLMIDDDAALNELLVEYFERFGHKLATAVTAAEGFVASSELHILA